jgi:iron complex outermembrane recepter protein
VSRTIKALAKAAVWACVLAGGAQRAAAQTTGELAGTVRDPAGTAAPGATVTVNITGRPLAAVSTITNDEGRFGLSVPPGRYDVTVEMSGFQSWSRTVELSASGMRLEVLLRFSDRVTVTGTRTGTADIQTTAVSITALDTKTLDQATVERIEHLMGLVPTLSVSQTPGDTPLLTLRGIGSNAAVPGGDPNVTMQVDGVYLARGNAMALDFLDVERVEVLRGPQGTLFGRNSIGGTVNIITRQPTNTLETRARLTAGNYDTLRVESAISGPLMRNKIMGSIAFLRGSRDGFVADVDDPDHSLGSDDTWAGRGQLRIVFGGRHDLLISSDYSNFRGVPLTLARPLAPGPIVPPNPPPPAFDVPHDFWSVRPNDLAESRNTQVGTSARLTVRLGDTATLTSLTAYRDGDNRLFVDSDTTEHAVATTRTSGQQRQISQEVTIAQQTGRLNWVGGVYAFDERIRGQIEITGETFRGRSTVDTEAWALFGQARYLVRDRVGLIGGLRYSREREDGVEEQAYHVTAGTEDGAWTPKASIEFGASRESFLFVSATRGFKSGGVNVFTPTSDQTFRPELAWSYEAGFKQTLPGGRGRLNTAFFYVDYRDLQVQSFLGAGVVAVSNAGRASSKGLEVEGTLAAGRGLQFLGIVSWLDARYGQYVFKVPRGRGITEDVDAAGKRLREAPEWSGSASALYELQTGTLGTVSVRGDAAWQTRVFFTPPNEAVQSQYAYALVHARTTFVSRSRRWEVSVYARNLGGQEHLTATWLATGRVAFSGRPGEPRHWGTQFTIRR